MMYVNYCTREDFQRLVDMNIDVAGHIVICRYGEIFRGTKVKYTYFAYPRSYQASIVTVPDF